MLILLQKGSVFIKGEKGRELKKPGDIIDLPEKDALRLIELKRAVNPEAPPSDDTDEDGELSQEEYDAAYEALEVLELGPELTNKLIDAKILSLEDVIKAQNKVLSPIVGDDKVSKNLRSVAKEVLKSRG